MTQFLILAALLFLTPAAQAANENSLIDGNRGKTLIGESAATGEIRRIKTNDAGALLVESSGTFSVGGSSVSVTNVDGTTLAIDDAGGSITVDGSVTVGDGGTALLVEGQGWTAPTVSTASVSNVSATQVFFADSTAVTRGVCNESSDDMRIGNVSFLTTAVGFLVRKQTCQFLDTNQRYFRGDLHMISTGGAPGKISTLEGQQ